MKLCLEAKMKILSQTMNAKLKVKVIQLLIFIKAMTNLYPVKVNQTTHNTNQGNLIAYIKSILMKKRSYRKTMDKI